MRTLIPLLLFLLPCVSCSAQSASQLDGNWWLLQKENQRAAFYSGYYACYVWDVGFRDLPENFEPVKSVTNFYLSTERSKDMPVTEVFKKVDAAGPRRKRPLGDDKYGADDGEYWRQVTKPERIEFVRGYLACQKLHFKIEAEKPIESYVDELSAWYRIDDTDPGQIDLKRSNEKIPAVLAQLLKK
ncbi:MAG TPA: hypothetical protein VGC79_06790 [Polyangiaceae bacterium]